MPTLYTLKPAFQGLLRPLSRSLARAGVTPNLITVGALVLSVATGTALALRPEARWPLLTLPPVLLVRMALNALDGMMAREEGLASPLGALFNEIGDVVADAALFLPLALVPGMPQVLVVAAVFGALLTEMAGVTALMVGSERRYDGPLGKSDRAFLFGGMALALGLGVPAGPWMDILLWIALILLVWTVINRCRRALAVGVDEDEQRR